MIGSVNRSRLKEILNIADPFEILLVLAIGKPKETVVIEEMQSDAAVKYWRDADGHHHVPKRRLGDIIITCYE